MLPNQEIVIHAKLYKEKTLEPSDSKNLIKVTYKFSDQGYRPNFKITFTDNATHYGLFEFQHSS